MTRLWALVACLMLVPPAMAQPVTRIKATLIDFDGKVMQLASDAAPKDQSLSVSVTPDTRYVVSRNAQLADLRLGNWAGALVRASTRGELKASRVYVYADALRGTGEGRFPDKDHLLVNGEVMRIDFDSDMGGVLTLHYRGAVLTQTAGRRAICEGRANPAPYASALGCADDARIAVGADVPVSSLTVGTADLLTPGVTLTVSMTKRPDGSLIAAGVVVEKPDMPEEKSLEKAPPKP